MEKSNYSLDEAHVQLSFSQEAQPEEVYHMPRLTVSTKTDKKHSRKERKVSSQGMEINDNFRMAARGYGNSHRVAVDGDFLAQNILSGEGQGKKKGFCFLCC
jgi:hypothetical protein